MSNTASRSDRSPNAPADPLRAGQRAAPDEAGPLRGIFARKASTDTERRFPEAGAEARQVRLRSDEVLYSQDDPVPFFYLIGTGHMKLTRTSRGGDTLIVDLLGAGSLFGPGLTSSLRANHTAAAKGEATLSRYTLACLERAIAQDPTIATLVVNELADHLQLAERRLQAMLGLGVRSRVVIALRDLATETGTHCAHGHEIDVPITQQELAELVGASRPVVSLELNEMRRHGLLSYTRKFICLDRPEALLEWIGKESAGVSRRTDDARRHG